MFGYIVCLSVLMSSHCRCVADVKSPESGHTLPRASNLSQESIQIHKVLTEFLAGLSRAAAEDVRRQMQVGRQNLARVPARNVRYLA